MHVRMHVHTLHTSPSLYTQLQLHMILSPFGHQCSVSPETGSISSETGDGPPQKIPEPSVTSQEEEEENLSDTDSESEWDPPGPVTRV